MAKQQNPEEEEFTQLKDIGEFGLIDRLTKNFPLRQSSSLKGIGDDAAHLDYNLEQTVVSTDLLVEGVHFDLTYMPPRHLGYKAAVVNFSDIYAMNAIPTQLLVGIAVSNRFGVEFLEEVYAGIRLACDVYDVDLVGGDTTSSYSGLMLSLTAMGTTDEASVTYRSGAKETDLLVLTGDVGGAYLGLQILEREKSVFMDNKDMQPDLTGNEYVLQRQLKPEARKDVIETLAALKVKPTSMIDVSDGLSSEILHLSEHSKVGFRVMEEKIPVDPNVYRLCEEFELNTTTVALSGGEDYELLFTIDIKDHDKIKGNPNMTVIGYATDLAEGNNLLTRDNQVIKLKAQGWKGFEN
jgi:thiamine-monophosphate kinase